ncbi:MAG: hypothetical protein M0036_21655 [Desulfobacteraceae bacterium]|nr:hypothetical protein [Desulfobacteraceae bacterium]
MTSFTQLKERLGQIEVEIEEAKKRLGAHSIKPVLMAALFALEDERDMILQQLKAQSQCCCAGQGAC